MKKELKEETLEEVGGGRSISPKINVVICTKCGSTVNTKTTPYTCPKCGELKAGEYRSSSAPKARFI
ncbi:MAG: hypothetical protein PUD62_00075 [Solobacterium sp.]|nr:hypothetical protein [Solobacterium sp.]